MTTTPLDRSFDDLRRTLGDYSLIVRRRWRIALLTLGVVGTIAFWYSQYLPREYAAATTFERRDDIVLQNLVRGNSPYSFAPLKTTMQRDLTGSRALAAAADAAGLLPPDTIRAVNDALQEGEREALEGALARYGLRTSVKLHNNTNSLDVVELRVTANDPEIARRFVVALRDEYITRTQYAITDVLERTRAFFAGELERYENEARNTSASLNASVVDYPGVDPRDPASVGTRLESLRSDRDRLTERLTGLDAEIAAREQFLTNLPGLYTEHAALGATENKPDGSQFSRRSPIKTRFDRLIEQVEMQIADARTIRRMRTEHPDVRALETKLASLRAARSELLANLAPTENEPRPAVVQRVAPPAWRTQEMRVDMELKALRAQRGVAFDELTRAEERYGRFSRLFDELVSQSGDLQQLEIQLQESLSSANVWRQNLLQLQRILAAQSEERGTAFTLVEDAKASTRPVKPQLGAIFFVCLGVGLAAAALIVGLAELLDRSFRSVAQVSRSLNIPVLECVGVIDTPRERRRKRRTRFMWTPALGLVVASLATSMLLAYVSIQNPGLHRRTLDKVHDVVAPLGVTVTSPAATDLPGAQD